MKLSIKEILIPLAIIPLFFVSSVMSKEFTDPFFIPKTYYYLFAFSALTIVIGSGFVFRKKNVEFDINLLDIFIISFIIYSFIRLIYTEHHTINELLSLNLFLSFGVYFIVKFVCVTNNKSNIIKVILLGILLSVFIQLLQGLLQYADIAEVLSKDFDLYGAFGNPGPFTNYIVSVIPIALGLILYKNKENKIDRWLYYLSIAIILMSIIVLPLSKARTSWIVAIVVSILMFIYKYRNKKWFIAITGTLWKKLILFILIVILGFFAGKFLYEYKKDSSLGRLFIWKTTIEIIKDNPVFGTGLNTFPEEHNEYQAKYFSENPEKETEGMLAGNVKYAFNEYLHMAAELGIVGLILLLAICLIAIFAIKNEDTNSYFLFSIKISLIAILLSGLFSYPMHNASTLLHLYVFLGLISSFSQKNVQQTVIKQNTAKFIGVVLILLSIWNISFNKKRFNANKEWTKAAVRAQRGHMQKTIKTYEKIYPLLKYDEHFLYNYGSELSLLKDYNKSIEILEEAEPRLKDADLYTYLASSYEGIKDYKKAEWAFKRASFIVPHRLYPKYRLVYIYINTQRMDEALLLAEEIINTKEKVVSETSKQIKKELRKFVEVEKKQTSNNINNTTSK